MTDDVLRTVVIADDHPTVRSGIRADLGLPFVVVAEAGDASDALAAIETHRPDVVVCDLNIARGYTYRQVGGELFIAEKTVENHVRNILGKLHLTRRAELIRWAADHGIG